MTNLKDITGQRFGRLVAIRLEEERTKNGGTRYLCRCDCGNEKVVARAHLVDGRIRSCGCLLRESTIERNKKTKVKHGHRYDRIYYIWKSIKGRTGLKSTTNYKNYGAKGITMCEEWKEFTTFYNWAMANGYRDDLTIDRIDPCGNYEPSNCRWVTPKEQANNRRSNHWITYNGHTKTISQWADVIGISYSCFQKRLKSGRPLDEIMQKEIPRKNKKSNK